MDIPMMDWELAPTSHVPVVGASFTTANPPSYEPMTRSESVIRMAPRSRSPYRPIVEPVSPPPGEVAPDKQRLISEAWQRVDQEIRRTNRRIHKLREHLHRLENENERQSVPEKTDPPILELSKMTLSERIFAENKAKASESHKMLTHLAAPNSQPVIYTPSEETVKRHELFKDRLVLHLRRQAQMKQLHQRKVDEAYENMSASWCETIKKTEASFRPKTTARYRTVFEATFPVLKPILQERERCERHNARSQNDWDTDFNTHKLSDKLLSGQAVIPKMLSPNDPERKHPFINRNGYIPDLIKEFEQWNSIPWTPETFDLFKEKLKSDQKDFHQAAQIVGKSIGDCVMQYYLNKHKEDCRLWKNSQSMKSEKEKPSKKRIKAHDAETSGAPGKISLLSQRTQPKKIN